MAEFEPTPPESLGLHKEMLLCHRGSAATTLITPTNLSNLLPVGQCLCLLLCEDKAVV
jgi:hypothetical protein